MSLEEEIFFGIAFVAFVAVALFVLLTFLDIDRRLKRLLGASEDANLRAFNIQRSLDRAELDRERTRAAGRAPNRKRESKKRKKRNVP